MVAIIGGTASVIGGGKFANGAWTSAMQYIFNAMTSRNERSRPNRNAAGRAKTKKLKEGVHDGYLTLEEANFHWRNGDGTPVQVDATMLDFSAVNPNDFSYNEASGTYRQTYTFPKFKGLGYSDDFVVHGTVVLELSPNGSSFTVLSDTYDFDIHPTIPRPNSTGRRINTPHPHGATNRRIMARNLETRMANTVAGFGGDPYEISFRGSVPLGE